MSFLVCLAATLLIGCCHSASGQQPTVNSISGLQQSMSQLLQVFNGNDSSAAASQSPLAPDTNHFKLLERDGDFLLVGARNLVYNLSLSTMREQRRLEWMSSEEDVKMCRMKGKSIDQCQNYIRVLKLQSPDTLFVCGTNAYKPRCRTYLITSNAYELVSEMPGEGACPYQETQNVTSLFAEGELYSATAAQFSGIDGLIHRSPLRTEQFNPKQLNSPNFVSSFSYGEHVYFLFREVAIEHINCGKAIYSRIARVCINDSGGPSRASRERWTSFVKARLNCSIPGEFPFHFDEIQASTQVVVSPTSGGTGSGGPASDAQSDLLYAVFTTPTNSIGGSAVCAYRMSDVLAAFDGPFKSQSDSQSNWLPVPESRVPQPRPGICVNDSRQLPDERINFIKENPLMDQAVEPLWSQPLVMMASINFRFTQIAVDARVETLHAPGASAMRTDVIFVSTDDGRVFKLINTHQLVVSSKHRLALNAAVEQPAQYPPYYSQQFGQRPTAAGLTSGQASPTPSSQQQQQREQLPDVSSNTVVVEELHLFDSRTPILNLLIHYPPPTSGDYSAPASGHHPKLVVLSGRQLKAVPLSRCERALSCADCLGLFDPYCAWDTRQAACLSLGSSASAATPLGWYPAASSRPRGSAGGWFPANSAPLNMAAPNNHTLAWWSQCPLVEEPGAATSGGQLQQQVGAPYRSLFSSHLQVPSRFDYASNHHLSHTALVSLSTAPLGGLHGLPAHQAAALYNRSPQLQQPQQPVSECLTFCGGLHTPLPSAAAGSPDGQQLMMSCADYVQRHYATPGGSSSNQLPGFPNFPPINNLHNQATTGSGSAINLNQSNQLYTSENLYFAVIICALFGLILGLGFGFAIGRNSKRHDSSICSSTFDETNLYMASTGSHQAAAAGGHHLFSHAQLNHRLQQHPLLAQAAVTGSGQRGLKQAQGGAGGGNHLFASEAAQCLVPLDSGTGNASYGNQQQMLLHLTGQGHGPPNGAGNFAMGTHRALPAPPPSAGSFRSVVQQQQQLTPNSLAGSTGTGSSSSTQTTAPANNEHLAQGNFYLNQQQQPQQQQPQNFHQRTFTSGSAGSSSKGSSSSGGCQPKQNNSSSFLQQATNAANNQQPPQQNNKIYL